jgi:hypothetical protein
MASASPRRRFQFSLRTLFVVVTLLAVACGYVVRQREIVMERMGWHSIIQNLGGHLVKAVDAQRPIIARIPWLRECWGDSAIQFIVLPIKSKADLNKIKSVFPEAEVSLSASSSTHH